MEVKGRVTDSASRVNPQHLIDLNALGAIRYLSYESAKNINRAEAQGIYNAGKELGLVWETTADMVRSGGPGGDRHGQDAAAQIRDIEWGGDFIYAAVDYPISSAEYPTADAYFAAFAKHVPVLCYSPYAYLEHRGDGWQTAGMSGSGSGSGGSVHDDDGSIRRLSKHARMYQRIGQAFGGKYDLNDVYDLNWGGWRPGKVTQGDDDLSFSKWTSEEQWSEANGVANLIAGEDVAGPPYEGKRPPRNLTIAGVQDNVGKLTVSYVTTTQAILKALNIPFHMDQGAIVLD